MINGKHNGKSKNFPNERTTIEFGVTDYLEFLYFPYQCKTTQLDCPTVNFRQPILFCIFGPKGQREHSSKVGPLFLSYSA